jgi:hypothetical protein
VRGHDCIQAERNGARASAPCDGASVESYEAGSDRRYRDSAYAMQLRLRVGQPIERLYRDARLELARGRPATVQHLMIVRELL